MTTMTDHDAGFGEQQVARWGAGTGMLGRSSLLGALVAVMMLASSCAWIARASVDSNGVQANGSSGGAAISSGGSLVAFSSSASNLVSGDTNGVSDVFVRDVALGTTTRVSVDSNGVQANGSSGDPVISSDGRYVAFISAASNLVPGTSTWGAFVHDRQTGVTDHVGNGDYLGAMADDGRRFLFGHLGYREAGEGDTLYYRDLGEPSAILLADSTIGYDMSADGRRIVYTPWSYPYGAGPTTVYDTTTGTSTSLGVVFPEPSLSADGRYLAFTTGASLVPEDTNGMWDVYVHDTTTGSNSRVSVGPAGQQGNFDSEYPSISADGTRVAFWSFATWDGLPFGYHGWVYDATTGTSTRVSADSLGDRANADSSPPSISPDGRFVAFSTGATNLVSGDTNGVSDVIVRAVDTPGIDTVTPDTLTVGTTSNVTVTGSGFGPGTSIATFVTNPNGVTVDAVDIVSETQLDLTVTVDPGAAVGPRSLYLQVPGPGPGEGDMTASLANCPDCLAITP